ncbi:TetR/AcrR family transcriptional regulator [Xanthocytophaga agilis]|uniref:TetR/AcrR family transcriptional regulator n=1 Tax=Xanthocytophaga agilis TaxID=3048010 RepID=A0AAE3RDC6_9BACT|nr:TetR/AcrR family transcriptional regulator [Xanthocytophaga agilis]MDJ1506545.1 TetR/AcrR family transcriptional regulator [Xanthocytophaga agilis]
MGRNKNFVEEDILDKVIILFQKQGYNSTSPEQLVSFLGLSRSSIYSTFGDKRELLIKALQRYRQITKASLDKIIKESNDPLSGIWQIFNMSVDGCYHPENPSGCFLVNSIVEFGSEDSEARQILNDSYTDCRDALCHFLQLTNRNMSNGSLQILADYLINAICGIVISAKAGMNEKQCRNVVEMTLSVLKF